MRNKQDPEGYIGFQFTNNLYNLSKKNLCSYGKRLIGPPAAVLLLYGILFLHSSRPKLMHYINYHDMEKAD